MQDDRDIAEEVLRPHLLERGDKHIELGLVFAADVDEDVLRLDRVRGNQRALEEPKGNPQHDLPVLEGARLGLVGVDHEIVRLGDLVRLRNEAPLASCGEECAAAATEIRGVELRNHIVGRQGSRCC